MIRNKRMTPVMLEALANIHRNKVGYPVDRNNLRTYKALERKGLIEPVATGAEFIYGWKLREEL